MWKQTPAPCWGEAVGAGENALSALASADEPLSALDARIRAGLREDIRTLQRKLGITTIFVTHDQRRRRCRSPTGSSRARTRARLSRSAAPATSTTARAPASSHPSSARSTRSRPRRSGRGNDSRVGQTVLRAGGAIEGAKAGEARSLALRPEALRLGPPADGANALTGAVEDATVPGAIVRLRVRLDQGGELLVDAFNLSGASFPERGEAVTVSFSRDDLIVLDLRCSLNSHSPTILLAWRERTALGIQPCGDDGADDSNALNSGRSRWCRRGKVDALRSLRPWRHDALGDPDRKVMPMLGRDRREAAGLD